MNSSEQEAHNSILRWCRSGKRGIGHPVMRSGVHGFVCAVIDLNASEPKPGGFSWETQPKLKAAGDNWSDVLDQLRRQGADL